MTQVKPPPALSWRIIEMLSSEWKVLERKGQIKRKSFEDSRFDAITETLGAERISALKQEIEVEDREAERVSLLNRIRRLERSILVHRILMIIIGCVAVFALIP